MNIYRQNRRLRRKPKVLPCSICEKIANTVEDWDQFIQENWSKGEIVVGSWQNYLEAAKHCSTCQRIVNYFQSDSDYVPFRPACKVMVMSHKETLWITASHDTCGSFTPCENIFHGLMELVPSEDRCPSTAHFISVKDDVINVRTLRRWVDHCDKTHQGICHGLSDFNLFSPPPWMLLIDVEKNCIVTVTKIVKYTCLSYVWGQDPDPFQTTKENFEELLQQGSLKRYENELPQTIRDAISLTKALSIPYFWVDRLCVVQNDKAAKYEQIAWMASIYANSYFTIVAADGPDAQYGIRGIGFGSIPRSFRHDVYRFGRSMEFALVCRYVAHEPNLGTQEWHSRAWTFQERLVSKRCLVFCQQTVKWECQRETSFESMCLQRDGTGSRRKDFSITLSAWPDLFGYCELVRMYSRRKLSFSDDALNAFSAVIQCFSRSFQAGFFFGLPEFFFDMALTWNPSRTLSRRYGFPTWSWLGWEGEVEPGWSSWWEPYMDPPWRYCESMVQWRKRCVQSQEFFSIDNSYQEWQDFRFDHESAPPTGWQRRNGVYEHESLTSEDFGYDPSTKFYHPVPFHATPLAPNTMSWLPFLYGKVRRAWFTFGDSFLENENATYGNQPASIHLLNSGGKWAGIILSHFIELSKPVDGNVCEVVGISYGECQKLLDGSDPCEMKIRPELEDKEWYKFINVLWLWRVDEVAYRVGAGRIWKEMWDRHEIQEIDIVLG